MSEDVLEINIIAHDNASKTFKSIGNVLGSTFKIGLASATAGLTAFAGALAFSVNEAMEAEVTQAKLNAVLKSTGGIAGMTADEVNSLATKLSHMTRFSDDAIVASETMLLTFTRIGKKVFPQATEATLNMSEALGMDATSAAVMLGKALNDPVQGVTALRRVGVTLTEQQEEMIRQFMEVGDIASAQKVILDELETEFGGVAVAAGDTLAGKLTILKNRLFEVAEEVGGVFIPILTKAADFLLETVIPNLERFGARLEWAFGMGKTEGIFELKAILSELGLEGLAPLVDIADKAITTFARLADTLKSDGLIGVFDQLKIELIKAAPGVLEAVKDFAKTHIITPLWNELKDPNNWLDAGKFALILTKELLGIQWNASEWIWKNFTSRMWDELMSRENWVAAGDFARQLVGDILGVVWDASQWVRDSLIIPLWDNLMKRENWVAAGDFARNLMGSILGATWDASQWVRNNIIAPIQREIDEQFSFINIPNPFSGGGGGEMVTGRRGNSNQTNYPPGTMPTYTGRLNYNSDYQGPRSILRDSGGSGIAGHPYRIGLPELFIPDRSGTFAPLSDGDMIANTISSLQDAVSELTDMLRRAGMGGGSQQSAPNYNLTIHTNSSDERIRSDYESMRVWAGA